MIRIVIADDLRRAIENEASAANPRECCGLIEGVVEGSEYRATALHPSPNLAPRDDRFEIAPDVQFAALKAARANGHRIIGCYHSHPNGQAEPSRHDLAGAGEDGFVWLIASPPELKAFVYERGGFCEIGLATGADCVTSSSNVRN